MDIDDRHVMGAFIMLVGFFFAPVTHFAGFIMGLPALRQGRKSLATLGIVLNIAVPAACGFVALLLMVAPGLGAFR